MSPTESGMKYVSWTPAMNDRERKLMDALGISVAQKNVYSYRQFRYERLDDALRYAELDTRREGAKADRKS